MQYPASRLRKPVTQFALVAPHRIEGRMQRRHQGAHQQRAQGVEALVFAVARKDILDLGCARRPCIGLTHHDRLRWW